MNRMTLNEEALAKRGEKLAAHRKLNGIDYVLVEIEKINDETVAKLTIRFFNNHVLGALPTDAGNLNVKFTITKSAGSITNQYKRPAPEIISPAVKSRNQLILLVAPAGDYSTYTLTFHDEKIDPFFSSIDFKFRPGCFNNNCAPSFKKLTKPSENPKIDYLAKDFESFKHMMINAMKERIAGWEPTSEADFDVMLLELFSVAGDELSDFQDRVMNEAFFTNARKRVSLARHARLVDYHIHQGNQASGVLAVQVDENYTEMENEGSFYVKAAIPDFIWFQTAAEYFFHKHLNQISIHTWSDSITALKAGATSADLKIDAGVSARICEKINDGSIKRFLIREEISPATGKAAGRDIAKRQILHLQKNAQVIIDPLTGSDVLRVHWEGTDALLNDYCTYIECNRDASATETDTSLFYGNLVDIFYGKPSCDTFHPPLREGESAQDDALYYEIKTDNSGKEYVLCTLQNPLLYKNTPLGGEVPPRSTLMLSVELGGAGEVWEERIDLINSDSNDTHFAVETDELGVSRLRFGNGANGAQLAENAIVKCYYQSGYGPDGNTGADSHVEIVKNEELPKCLHEFLPAFHPAPVESVRLPFSIDNGRAPEPAAEIIRKAPEAFKARQLRAVTLNDYIKRAEELPEVFKAAARYGWSGSWRVVRVVVDPAGSLELSPAAYRKVYRHLNAVKLIGDDLEIRPPRFVPLRIKVSLCLKPEFWKEDIEFLLAQTFSDNYTDDGRLAFFHPDQWTFGQPLRASQIIGEIMKFPEVDHVILVEMKKRSHVESYSKIITVGAEEIILVKNDPSHAELGTITFDIRGGRR